MSSDKLTQRDKRPMLQKVSQVVGIVSIVIAFICGGYLLTLDDEADKVMKAFYGSISFFCFMMGLVLKNIGSANLPDLTVPSDEEIKASKEQD